MVVVENTYGLGDLDRTLKKDIMNIIDYNFRFRKESEKTLEEIVEEFLPEVEKQVELFYQGIAGVEFNITAEDVVKEYKNTMM